MNSKWFFLSYFFYVVGKSPGARSESDSWKQQIPCVQRFAFTEGLLSVSGHDGSLYGQELGLRAHKLIRLSKVMQTAHVILFGFPA